MKLSRRAQLALTIAQEAGGILLQQAAMIQKSKGANKHINHKQNNVTGGKEIVTTVDRLIDNFIIKSLERTYPGEFFLTEESYKQTDTRKRLRYKSLWIIDPIDGTQNFSLFLLGQAKKKRQQSFSISVAWARNGLIQLGVIHTPVLSETWIAEKGHGTWYKQGKKPWRQLVMRANKSTRLTIALNSHERVTGENTASLAGHTLVYPSSLAYRIVGTTTGHHDALISFKGGSKEWDVAAADIIVQEAGGQLLDVCQKPLRYNKPDLINHLLLIAGHPAIIKKLLSLIQSKPR